ncbi:MAG: tyrosine-protein phosphatase [Deltaproteobacteria bacterium]|nr:tyrosine-protein phosphatase [Deltaproteobacteria bacterium]
MKGNEFALFVILGVLLLNPKIAAKDVLRQIEAPKLFHLNFGVVVRNENYTIYRSAALGSSGLKLLSWYMNANDLPFPKTIIYMNKDGYAFPQYFALQEYFKSNDYGFTFHHPFGDLRTYVDGDNPYYPKDDIDTASVLGKEARRYFELRDDGVDGGLQTVLNVLDVVLNPANQPVLIHCQGGRHRTGMLAMILRYLQGGFWVNGPRTRKQGLELNPAQYEYYVFNKLLFREENIKFIEAFSEDDRFKALRDQYGESLQED